MNTPIERYFIAVRELMLPDGDAARQAFVRSLIDMEKGRTAGRLLVCLAASIGGVVPLAASWFAATRLLAIGPTYIDRRFGLLLSLALVAGSCLVGTAVFLAVFRVGEWMLYRFQRKGRENRRS